MSTRPFSPQHRGHMGDKKATEIDSPGLKTAPQLPGHVDWSSYGFLEFNDSNLEEEDRTFLANKGSLHVPESAALDEFAQRYFLHLHPTLPVLDEAEFWGSYTNKSAKTQLLVLQALLFAGCPYISITTLQRCGFHNKKDARSHFYTRAKLLFNLAEHEPVARTQAAILLSHHASAVEPRAGSEWLTLAIQSVHLIDRTPEKPPTVKPMLKKRLWWSIILRDRYLCLTLRRRTQVPEITPGLDLVSFDEHAFSNEIHNSYVYDAQTKAILVKVLKDYYELALALSDMMALVYGTHGINTVSLSRDACTSRLNKASLVKRSLEEWKSSTVLPILMTQTTHEPVALFANLTYMYYYAARINLAHFEILVMQQQPGYVSGDDEKLHRTTGELYSYMSQQTAIMEYLSHCGSAHILPLSVLGCLPMPLLTTAINISLSPSPQQREIHKRTIDTLGQIVKHLEQVYEAAAMISSGMSHFLQLAYTTIQLQSPDSDPVLPTSLEDCFDEHLPDGSPETVELARTWKDFLLQSPRAYLLISTTVDFSLSLGKLPRTDSLPDLLTCLLPGSLRICLPWDVNPTSSIPPPSLVRRERSRMKIINRLRMQQQAKKQAEEEFNLDYLDLSAVH